MRAIRIIINIMENIIMDENITSIETASGLGSEFMEIKDTGNSIGKAWRKGLDSLRGDTKEEVTALTNALMAVSIKKDSATLVPFKFHEYARTCFGFTLNHDESMEAKDIYDEWKKVKREVTVASGCNLDYIAKPQKSKSEKEAELDLLVMTNPTSKAAKAWIKQKPVNAVLDTWEGLVTRATKQLDSVTVDLKAWGKQVVKNDGSLDVDLKKMKQEMDKVFKAQEVIVNAVPKTTD